MNVNVVGEVIFIPMPDFLRGQAPAGFAWNMPMNCLAEGREISLPALSSAASTVVASTVRAYESIRKQLKKKPISPIWKVTRSLSKGGRKQLFNDRGTTTH